MAAAGGLAALLLAKLLILAAIPLAVRFAPRIAAAELSVPVLVFCAAVSIGAAMVSGLLPAVRLSRTDLQAAADTSAVLRRLQSTPGVEAASAINHAPLSGTIVPAQVTVHGSPGRQQALYRNITPGYFGTLGIAFVAGRDFTDADIAPAQIVPAMRHEIGQAAPVPRTLGC